MRMSICDCGAPIRWAKVVVSGKDMPLDASPALNGNVTIHADGATCTVLTKREVRELRERAPEALLFVSHFATCPNSAHHRKR